MQLIADAVGRCRQVLEDLVEKGTNTEMGSTGITTSPEPRGGRSPFSCSARRMVCRERRTRSSLRHPPS